MCSSSFLNYANGTKLRQTSHMIIVNFEEKNAK